jgi:uncharacterized membrane protein
VAGKPLKHQHMKTALTIFLIIHIASGMISLIVGFLSMLNKKGGKRHRLTGKIFFIAMSFVFLTATAIALIKGLSFLLMVGFFSYYLACSGYRSLHLKKLHLGERPASLDWIISIIGVIAGAALIIYSYTWFVGRGAWGLVPLAFGTVCITMGVGDIKKYYKKPEHKLHWILSHASKMGGSFAASLTAFVVTNVEVPKYGWILWILPGVLVGLWITRLSKPYAPEKLAI